VAVIGKTSFKTMSRELGQSSPRARLVGDNDVRVLGLQGREGLLRIDQVFKVSWDRNKYFRIQDGGVPPNYAVGEW
jgi:hypothetical protein